MHLFALKLGSDADNRDNDVGLLGQGDRFRNRIGDQTQPYQSDAGATLAVLQLDGVAMSFFQLDGCLGRLGIVKDEVIHDQFAIKP